MTTITLELPDELAARLVTLRDRLPQLLSIALELSPSSDVPLTLPALTPAHRAFEEMLDFLASGPSPEKIVAFKVSPAAQARLEELLEKNRQEGLTDEEAAELDVYSQVNHILILLKARARLALSSPN
jgi:hypothetical protein